jgi:hypothetical protein
VAGVLPLLSPTSYSRRVDDVTVVSSHNFDIFSGEGRKIQGEKSTLVPDGLKDESFYSTLHLESGSQFMYPVLYFISNSWKIQAAVPA